MLTGTGTGEKFTGILNTVGVLIQGAVANENNFDLLRRARTKVFKSGRTTPTAVVLHPDDLAESLGGCATSGRFAGPGQDAVAGRSSTEGNVVVSLLHRPYSCVMRPLRYSINVTLDGCCDHRAMFADEDLHRHAAENLGQADALLFGRVTYEMMEAAWRPPGEHELKGVPDRWHLYRVVAGGA
jgi:hypothetical protein